jgi:hypothetical protein
LELRRADFHFDRVVAAFLAAHTPENLRLLDVGALAALRIEGASALPASLRFQRHTGVSDGIPLSCEAVML